MVDFTKKLASKTVSKITNPIALYETLDRASDKGPMRSSQQAILSEWDCDSRNERDLIVKLHTGQGKTLVGLLMLQARLNEGKGPAVYLIRVAHESQQVAQTCPPSINRLNQSCSGVIELPNRMYSVHSAEKIKLSQTLLRNFEELRCVR